MHSRPLSRLGVAALVVASALLEAPAVAQTGPTVAELEQRVNAYARLLRDWAGLTRYGSDNAELPRPAPGEQRVVFLGDQITEQWGRGSEKFFPGKPYLNRGIGGQTTAQMLESTTT